MKHASVIFFIGLFAGLALWDVPVTDPWVIRAHVFSGATPPLEAFMPVRLPYPVSTWLHRPLTFIFYNIVYNTLGVNFILYRVFHAFVLGIFGYLVFSVLCKLGFERKIAAISSIFSILSPPTLISTWSVADSDVTGAVFVMVAFLSFLNMRPGKALLERSFLGAAIPFLIFSALSVFYKETSRFFLTMFIFSYILSNFISYGKLKKFQLVVLAYAGAFSLVFSIPMLLVDTPSYFVKFSPADMQHNLFVVEHVTLQLVYGLSVASVFMLFFTALINFSGKRLVNFLPFIVTALASMVLTKPLIFYNFLGMVFLSNSPAFLILPVLLILALSLNLYKREYRFASTLVLSTVFIIAVVFSLLLIPREDVSSRAFVYITPFLLCMLSDSIIRSWNNIKKMRQTFFIGLNRALLTALVIMVLYYFIASFATISTDLMQESIAEYATRMELNELNLSNSLVLYTKPLYPLTSIDLDYRLRNVTYDSSGFIFINAHKKSEEGLVEELCGKINTKDVPFERLTVQISREFPVLEDGYEFLIGDFSWVMKNYTFSFLKPGLAVSNWLSDYDLASYNQKNLYPQSLLEKFLHEKNATLKYSYAKDYYKIPASLEVLPHMLLNKIPFFTKYRTIGKLYQMDASRLNCDGRFPRESYKNRTFEWLFRNSTFGLYNGKNESSYSVIRMNIWSFYRQRGLVVYINKMPVKFYPGITDNWANVLYVPVMLAPGKNELKLESMDGCDIPSEVGAWEYDPRCISFGLGDVAIIGESDLAKENFLYGDNWYPEETYNNMTFRWMSQDALLYVYGEDAARVRFKFVLQSLNRSRTLELYLNEQFVESYNVSAGWKSTEILTPFLVLGRGENILRLHSKDGYDNPTRIGMWPNDTRLLSFQFLDITKFSGADLNNMIFYENNWYMDENYNDISYKWASQNATLSILNTNGKIVDAKLTFTVWTVKEPRSLEIYLGNNQIETLNVTKNYSVPTISMKLQPGENLISIHSREGCDIPEKIGAWKGDTRCLSFAFRNIFVSV